MFQSFIYLSKPLFNFWVNTYFMSQFFLSPLVFLTSVSLLRCYDLWACVMKFWLQSWVCFFSAVISAFQLFTRKLCLQFSGLRMRNFTWNRFPIKNLLIDSLLTHIVESTCLNRDMGNLNHRKRTKVDGSRLIPRKHTETLLLLSVFNFHWRHDPVFA